MRSIAIINQKGGVGKTTTAVNLSAALARAGHRVCLIDLDPQAHASLHLGVGLSDQDLSVYDVMTSDTSVEEIRHPISENLDLLPAHLNLAAVEIELAHQSGRELVLRDKIEADSSEYDYLIIDCPPSLGILTLNALTTVTEVFLPLQPHFLALHGLSKILKTVEIVSEHLNPRLRLTGVILCLYESGTRLANEVSRDVREFFEYQANAQPMWASVRNFEARVRRNIRLAEAPSFGQSIFEYAPTSHGAEDYQALAVEVLENPPKVPVIRRIPERTYVPQAQAG